MDAGGSFVAAWRDGAYGFVDIYAVGRFSVTGIRQGFELALGANPPSTHGTVSPPLVIEQSDGFAVGWTEYGGCFDEQPVSVVTRFTKRGESARDRFELSDPDCGSSSWLLAALASSPTAGLSVALFNGGRNSFQLFDRDGRPLFRRRIIGNPDPCPSNLECERLAAAAMRSNGDFAVIWQRWHGDSPSGIGSEVLAQVFDRSGRALGDRFQVDEGNPHAAVKPVAALSDDGILTVVWARQSGTANVLVYRQFKLQLQVPP
jgi:hypothetical protein